MYSFKILLNVLIGSVSTQMLHTAGRRGASNVDIRLYSGNDPDCGYNIIHECPRVNEVRCVQT